VCDSPLVCPSGTDTYDCDHEDDASCSLSSSSSGLGGLQSSLLFGMLLVRQGWRRRRAQLSK
jgi:hypothetical protein